MHILPLEEVLGWTPHANRWAPHVVGTHCPFCGRLVAFTLSEYYLDENRNTISASGACPAPACRRTIRVWALDPKPCPAETNKSCGELCMFPTPSDLVKPMKGADKIPSEIAREYKSAINVFKVGEWNATAICCRRVLEAVVQNLLPNDPRKGTLSEQLVKLKSSVDLSKPLTELADALRKGGNLGAHFDLEREPNQATARQMLDFIEFIMGYLYVLPGDVESFHKDITKQNEKPAPPPPSPTGPV